MQQMIPEFKGLSLADVFSNTQALKAGQMKLDAAQREQEAMEKVRQIYASGRGMDSPDVQREVMAAAPEYGLRMADLQAQLSKSQAEIGKDELEYFRDAAAGIASQFDQLPEDQRTDDNLHRIRDQYAGMVAAANPAWAKKLMAAPLDRNAMYALARSAAKYGGAGGRKVHSVESVIGADGKPRVNLIYDNGEREDTGMAPYNPPRLNMTDMGGMVYNPVSGRFELPPVGGAEPPPTKDGKPRPLWDPPERKYNEKSGEVTTIGQDGTVETKPVPSPALAAEANHAYEFAMMKLDMLDKSARDMLADPGLGGLSGVSGVTPSLDWPGGDTFNARGNLDTLKTKIGFDTLQAMRDASKTGGALGNVTEKELEGLQNSLTNLRAGQDEKEMRKHLAEVLDYTARIRELAQKYKSPQVTVVPGAAPAQQPARPRKYNSKGDAIEWDGKTWVPVTP